MINIGIIGTGAIATQFIKEVKSVKGSKVIGVSARNFEKTSLFAKKYNIEKPYRKVEDMLEDDKIHAIYVASFHPTHYTYSKMALLKGKSVLCEKPAALSKEEILELTKLARDKKVLFMEAMTVGFNPTIIDIKKKLDNGDIGEVVHIESSFGKVSSKVHKHNSLQAGGALYDIGIYNIYLQQSILGVPEDIQAFDRKNPWGVEGGVSVLCRYPNGATSSFYATMDSLSGSSAKIIGTLGIIEISDPWTTSSSYKLKKLDGSIATYTFNEDKWLGYEIQAFINTLETKCLENSIMTYSESIKLHQTIDRIKAILGYDYSNVERNIF